MLVCWLLVCWLWELVLPPATTLLSPNGAFLLSVRMAFLKQNMDSPANPDSVGEVPELNTKFSANPHT
jgi:hypothetical protein